MLNRNIVVVGGSAGATESVATLLKGLPSDLPATLFVALHVSHMSEEWLSERLRRVTDFQMESPDGKLPIQERHIYVVRPDRHLIVSEGTVVTSRGPRENQWRPAIDVLFRTAAVAYGSQVAYHVDSLVQRADQEIDRTLWAAIRLFEQRANIGRMMSDRERVQGREKRAAFHDARADESHQHAQKLRDLHAQRRMALE